jgi:ubiquinone/menaquinone biosynthesis C-methylase UbiE
MKKESSFWNRFWSWYARFYDGTGKTVSYQLMHKQIIHCIPNNKKLYLLDAGCGTGLLLAKLKTERSNVITEGIDFSASMLSVAKNKNTGAILKEADLDKPLPYKDDTFDIITSVLVIYNLPNPKKTIKEFKRVLKKDGILIIVSLKKNASMRKIIGSHISHTGFFRAIPLLFSLSIVGFANLILFSKKREFSLFDKEKLKLVAGVDDDAISSAYADQCWFICTSK